MITEYIEINPPEPPGWVNRAIEHQEEKIYNWKMQIRTLRQAASQLRSPNGLINSRIQILVDYIREEEKLLHEFKVEWSYEIE